MCYSSQGDVEGADEVVVVLVPTGRIQTLGGVSPSVATYRAAAPRARATRPARRNLDDTNTFPACDMLDELAHASIVPIVELPIGSSTPVPWSVSNAAQVLKHQRGRRKSLGELYNLPGHTVGPVPPKVRGGHRVLAVRSVRRVPGVYGSQSGSNHPC